MKQKKRRKLDETLFNFSLDKMVHNHSVCEEIFRDVCDKCPSVNVVFGDRTKCRERLDYRKCICMGLV